ncbi:ECF transporter S component [Mycoplasma corogypsi]|uniref:ECF transporter S component n=1 Tax=Mycoplasma corogypsi TaxID=2106 RepID=UPI003873757D
MNKSSFLNSFIVIKFKEFKLASRWTIRKMAFVAILIAMSVAFTVVSAQIMPLITLSSYKISFIGLPVKISGFIFGPLIGIFVGIVSDILSLLFIPPAGYNILYTVATSMNGLVAGVFGFYFVQFMNKAFSKEYRIQVIASKITRLGMEFRAALASNEKRQVDIIGLKIQKLYIRKKYVTNDNSNRLLSNIYLINAVIFLTLVVTIMGIIQLQIPDVYISKSIIPNKAIMLGLMTSGIMIMTIFVIVARFFMSFSRYSILVPIIVFSAYLELINIPLLSFADLHALGQGETSSFYFWFSQHILTSPIKIWFNTFVIYYSYIIISKLINKNANLSY